jgi:hypothetical protein
MREPGIPSFAPIGCQTSTLEIADVIRAMVVAPSLSGQSRRSGDVVFMSAYPSIIDMIVLFANRSNGPGTDITGQS